jgi:hypothetical protein
MVVPVAYSALKNYKKTKKYFTYALDNSLTKISYDIEHAIIKICEREIQSVRTVEPLKQELMSFQDFSMLEIFRHIDQYAHGSINADNLRVFFTGFSFCNDLDEEDILNWLRRYDRDVDAKLDFADFVTGLSPFCQYSQKATNLLG